MADAVRAVARPRETAQRARAERHYQTLVAGIEAAKGRKARQVAEALGVSEGTARTRIALGRALWASDPALSRRFLMTFLARECGPEKAAKLVALMLAGTDFAERADQ